MSWDARKPFANLTAGDRILLSLAASQVASQTNLT